MYDIGWPAVLGAATRTRVTMTVGTTTAVETIFELDDVYRVEG